jgi:quinol monooxygenase YgiN
LPDNLRIPHTVLKTVLIVGFGCTLLSILTLVILPQKIMGRCTEAPNTCRPQSYVTAVSIAHLRPGFGSAFEEAIESALLVKEARTRDGNIQYEVLRERQSPDEYRILQKWAGHGDYEAFVNEVEKKVFGSPVMKGILVGGKIIPQEELSTAAPAHCLGKAHGAFSTLFKSNCNQVWSVFSNWSDCTWISGCAYVTLNGATRAVHRSDGTISTNETLQNLDVATKTLLYTGSMVRGFVATVALVAEDSNCRLNYIFAMDRSEVHPTIGDIYLDLNANRIPFMEKRFG